MIQKYLYKIMETGIEAIKANPTLLDDLFKYNYDLDDAEVKMIKGFFAEKPPTVVNGYNMLKTTFPAIAVVMGNETEDTSFLDQSLGQDDDEDSDTFQMDIEGDIWNHNFSFIVSTDHPDSTLYYYEIVKLLIMINKQTMINDYDLLSFKYSGGDIMPDPRFLPTHAFVRQFTINVTSEFVIVLRDSKAGKAFKVSGLHISKEGSPSNIGKVDALVKPY